MVGYISTNANTTSRISSLSMEVGDEQRLYYYYNGNTLFRAYGYSSDTDVVTVTMGNTIRDVYYPFTLNAVGEGTATITVYTSSDTDTYRATLEVTVGDPIDMGITVSEANPSIVVGETVRITATATPAGLSSYDWSLQNIKDSTALTVEIESTSGNTATIAITANSMPTGSKYFEVRVAHGSYAARTQVNPTIIEDDSYVKTITITGSSTIDSGSTVTFTAVTSPTTADNRRVTWSISGTAASHCTYTTSNTSTGGRIYITADRTTESYRGILTATAADGGGAYETFIFDIIGGELLVESITLSLGAEECNASGQIAIYAVTYPSDVENGRVSWSVISGSDLVTQVNTAYSSSSRRSTLILGAKGTTGSVTVRATAADGGGVYRDITFQIVEDPHTIILQVASYAGDESMTLYLGFSTSQPLRILTSPVGLDYGVSIVSGSAVELLTGTGTYSHYVNPVAVGTSVVRAYLTEDSSIYDEFTFIVENYTEPYSYDRTVSHTLYYGEEYGNPWTGLASSIAGSNIKFHGGYATTNAPSGTTYRITRYNSGGADYVSTLPTAADGGEAGYFIAIDGTPSVVGESITFYAESDTETLRVNLAVTAKGSYTKTLKFDANLPTGATLTGSMPDDIVKDYCGESTVFELPVCTATVEGYVFYGWTEHNDLTLPATLLYPEREYTVSGGTQTVTLYAEWFPITEGFEYVGEGVFKITLGAGEPVDISFLNAGDYPVIYQPNTEAPAMDGLTFHTGTADYGGVLPQSTRVSAGNLTLDGTPTRSLGTPHILNTWGQRNIHTHYHIYITAGVLPDVGQDLTYVLDANGGTFPNGAEVLTVTAEDDRYVLPDWSVVDRPGYRLTGWVGDSVGAVAMGSTQMTIETWTAQWARDSRGYDTSNLPHPSVRIYRSLDEYVDVTYLQDKGGKAVVAVAENEEGTATVRLLNDYRTAGHCLLSDDCSLWNAGEDGPIRMGMYLRIENVESNGRTSYVFDGFITTITANAETVTVEAGDWITFLGKMGTTYRRNFYGDSRSSGYFDAGYDEAGGGLYADVSSMPDGAVIDGSCSWKVLTTESYTGSTETVVMGFGGAYGQECSITFPAGHDRVESIDITLLFRGRSISAYAFSGTATLESGGNSWFEVWSTSFTYVGTPNTLTLHMDFWNGNGSGLDVSGGEATLTLRLTGWSGEGHGTVGIYASTGTDHTLAYVYDGDARVGTRTVDMDVTLGDWKLATTGNVSTGRMYVTAIDGADDLTDAMLYTPSEDRVMIPFITDAQDTLAIMSSIAQGIGLLPISAGSVQAEVMLYRTGGGYALDYLQKLADIADSGGRMRAFAVRGYTTPILTVTPRYALTDAPAADIHYAGDAPTGAYERIPFSSFSPAMTMKNRPNLAVIRGTMSTRGEVTSSPIIVAVEDSASTDRRCGITVESVIADSSVNMVLDAATSAWGEVLSADLDHWEGSVTVPDIRRTLLPASGAHAGSGVPVRLWDSRNGLAGYGARVRQLRMDYNACTTQITLTNYSLAHSNGIADTTAMAVTSADVATGDTSTTLFNTQYVRVKTETAQIVEDVGNEVRGFLSDNTPFEFQDIAILQLPNGRSVLVATAPADGAVHAADDAPYDVVAVQVNSNTRINIRPSIRPDYYRGQTLILNLDFPTR